MSHRFRGMVCQFELLIPDQVVCYKQDASMGDPPDGSAQYKMISSPFHPFINPFILYPHPKMAVKTPALEDRCQKGLLHGLYGTIWVGMVL